MKKVEFKSDTEASSFIDSLLETNSKFIVYYSPCKDSYNKKVVILSKDDDESKMAS